MFGLNDVAFLGSLNQTPTDPNFANVSLLLHGDGTNGSTTIIDSSPSPKTVTAVGNAQISTAQSRFGGASITFNGSTDYLLLSSSSDFKFLASDFTIEAWIRASNVSGIHTIYSARESTGGSGVTFRISSGKLQFFYGAGLGLFTAATNISTNTWHHVALTREGNLFKLWLNGGLDGTSGAITASVSNNDLAPSIGAWAYRSPQDEFFNGHIDDLRITKGVARYTANFTPPTAPFPDA
jgi:hypothetical protein